jgi:hypothetical protein
VKRCVSFFEQQQTNQITYVDKNGKQIKSLEDDYDFNKNSFVIKKYNNKYCQILRNHQEVNLPMTKCNYDFCIFYIETPFHNYKLDLNSYFLERNIFDKSFLFFLLKTQHGVVLKETKVKWSKVEKSKEEKSKVEKSEVEKTKVEKTNIVEMDEINWMFIDHEMSIKILPSKCIICLEKEYYKILNY